MELIAPALQPFERAVLDEVLRLDLAARDGKGSIIPDLHVENKIALRDAVRFFLWLLHDKNMVQVDSFFINSLWLTHRLWLRLRVLLRKDCIFLFCSCVCIHDILRNFPMSAPSRWGLPGAHEELKWCITFHGLILVIHGPGEGLRLRVG